MRVKMLFFLRERAVARACVGNDAQISRVPVQGPLVLPWSRDASVRRPCLSSRIACNGL